MRDEGVNNRTNGEQQHRQIQRQGQEQMQNSRRNICHTAVATIFTSAYENTCNMVLLSTGMIQAWKWRGVPGVVHSTCYVRHNKQRSLLYTVPCTTVFMQAQQQLRPVLP